MVVNPPLGPGGGLHNLIVQRQSSRSAFMRLNAPDDFAFLDHLVIVRDNAAKGEGHGSRRATILSRNASAILYSFATASIAACSSGA